VRQWALTLLLFALPLFGQNTRFDFQATTTSGVGNLVPVLAIPGAQISFFTGCTSLPCATKAVTFQSISSGSVCPSTAQVVWQLPTATGCVATADSQGNFGGYFQSGDYQFTETVSGKTFGPFEFSVGGGGGGGSSTLIATYPWIDPKAAAFGASCSNNPAIDDSAAITSALAAAQAAGLEVQIGGICYIQHPIIWPSTAVSPDRGFGLRGAATGGTIKAAPGFPDGGTEAGAMIFRQYTTNGPTLQVTLRDITLDANAGTASACLTFEAQRLFYLDKVTCLSATGNGGGEMNFGIATPPTGFLLVGLTARDIEIDNGQIIAAKGAAARPNYGMFLNNNAPDGRIDNVVVNQNAIAGVYVNSGNNLLTKIHPFGFTSLQVPTATWPQYGIYLDTHAFTNFFDGTECDTVQTSCFFASKGFFTAVSTALLCNDGGTGSLCGEFIVTAASGAGHIHLYGGRLQAGSITPTGSPVNWLGSVDTGSDWLVEWPTQQIGFGTSSILLFNPILQSPTIFQPNVTGVLNANGGSVHVLNAGTTPGVIIESTTASAFPFVQLESPTNSWLMQLGGSLGNWELLDKSTNNIVVHIDEGAPGNSIAVDPNGHVSLASNLRTTQLFQQANGNFAGSCIMTAGTCSAQSFTHVYNFAPVCTCSWSGTGTLTGGIKCPSTAGTVTPASSVGSDTATVNWICVGEPN
jgi:hypothetical protein